MILKLHDLKLHAAKKMSCARLVARLAAVCVVVVLIAASCVSVTEEAEDSSDGSTLGSGVTNTDTGDTTITSDGDAVIEPVGDALSEQSELRIAGDPEAVAMLINAVRRPPEGMLADSAVEMLSRSYRAELFMELDGDRELLGVLDRASNGSVAVVATPLAVNAFNDASETVFDVDASSATGIDDLVDALGGTSGLELRYVDGEIYMKWPKSRLSAEVIGEIENANGLTLDDVEYVWQILYIDEAYIDEMIDEMLSEGEGDPATDIRNLLGMCGVLDTEGGVASVSDEEVGVASEITVFGVADLQASLTSCDPLTAMEDIVKFAGGASIVSENVQIRGVPTTQINFRLSLMDVMSVAEGMMTDSVSGSVDSADSVSDNAEDILDTGSTGDAMEDFLDMGDGTTEDGSSDPLAEMFGSLFFEVDIWIDKDSLIRRMSVSYSDTQDLDMFADVDDQMPDWSTYTDFYDYNAEVVVEAPPENLIIPKGIELT